MNIVGLDIGSRTVKIVTGCDGKLTGKRRVDTIKFYRNMQHYLDEYSGYRIFTTGYGRNSLDIPGATKIPELVSMVRGAVMLTGLSDFTLLDLGGQDSKVIFVNDGKMTDFKTNDKCAASSGRYVENMAKILGMRLSQVMEYYENPAELSSTCAIFGESEVVGHIAAGEDLKSIAAGVNFSVYKRVSRWLERSEQNTLVFTGGLSRSSALKYFIKKHSRFEQIIVPKNSEYCCALGLLSE